MEIGYVLVLLSSFMTVSLASLCGDYQRKFCLRGINVYLQRGGGTYSGLAKMGNPMVDILCSYYKNDTLPCLSDMRRHCSPVEEAELQGEIDVNELICYKNRDELIRTCRCLSKVEDDTFPCTVTFNERRGNTASRRNQKKIEQEDARLEYCSHIEAAAQCAYDQTVETCGGSHARWMRGLFDTRLSALKNHYACAAAAGLHGLTSLAIFILSWCLIKFGF